MQYEPTTTANSTVSRYRFTCVVLLVGVYGYCLTCGRAVEAATDSRPNVIVLFTDDQARSKFNFARQEGAERETSKNVSPNMDRLADDIAEANELSAAEPHRTAALRQLWEAWAAGLPEPSWRPAPVK